MKITATLNGVTVEKDLPTSLQEINFETYIKIISAGENAWQIISILLDIPYETLKKSRIPNIEKVESLLSFLSEAPQLTMPKTILGHPVSFDLNFEEVQRYEDLRLIADQIRTNEESNVPRSETLKKFCDIVAIYALTEYDDKKADELAPQFLKAPCTEVLAVANFTLVRFYASRLNIKAAFRKTPAFGMKKFRQALRIFLSGLGFSIRYALWRRRLRSLGMS